jgi:dethiobiotin synthetase
MSAYFITATGTDIGKTFVTAGLIRHLRDMGKKVSALKPVISGINDKNFQKSDSGVLLDALGENITRENIARISPWQFADPVSPDIAALRERRSIDFSALVKFSRDAIAAETGSLFIEGVGGVMVPLDLRYTVLDWMSALKIPVILVAGSYLGAISHTLSALDVLKRIGLMPALLVINESEDSTVPLQETADSIARFAAGVPVVQIVRNQRDFSPLSAILTR